MVYSLLSMLGTHDKDDMSRTLLAMSSSQDSCIAMRQSGCLPLLIQLLHGNDKDSLLLGPPFISSPYLTGTFISHICPVATLTPFCLSLGNSRGSKEARARASAALHNIVHSQPDDKRGRREIRVLHLLEQVRHYCEACWTWQENHERGVDQEDNPSECCQDKDIKPGMAPGFFRATMTEIAKSKTGTGKWCQNHQNHLSENLSLCRLPYFRFQLVPLKYYTAIN